MTLVLAIVLLAAGATAQATGSIAGCIVDPMHQPLPGVTVVGRGVAVRGTTETNTKGCYNLKGLPPGPYRVTVRLPGFTNVTRDNVNVAADTPASLDVTMSVSPICECIQVGGSTLADLVKAADAVVHLRIAGPLGGQPPGSRNYQHAAAVLHALKGVPPDVRTIPLLQNQLSGAPLPYDVDDEMVAFLRSVGDNGYSIINDDPGLSVSGQKVVLLFQIRDGQVTATPKEFSKYTGTTLDSLLYELRAAVEAR